MTDTENQDSGSRASRSFARKVRFSTAALVFERLWPRLWLLIALAVIFALLSFAGVWPYLNPLAHQAVLGVFGVAALVALIHAARIPLPTRDEAIRRLERRSGGPPRPAPAY